MATRDRTIGPFLLGDLLGRGAHGEVWRAIHRPTGTAVALKRLRRVRPEHAERLAREARALASLAHPAIATVHDLDPGADGASPWMALELGEGTLAESPPRTLPEVQAALLELLAGLAHAHARGVLHRDLKPSNVLWVGGQVKLADFGLSVSDDDDGPIDVSGTPLYLAPEQLSGDRDELGPWTDLYALGWLAWELAAGAHPWGGRALHELVFAQQAELPPSWPAHLPEPFGLWVRRCLVKDPGERFRRAADAARALAALDLRPDAVRAGPTSRPTSHTFTFDEDALWSGGDVASAEPSDAPFPPDWRPSRAWSPAPLPLAGLGLYAHRRVALVGRDEACDALWSALGRAHAGETVVVELRGDLGVGRSALARWLCERAHELGAASDLRLAVVSSADVVDVLADGIGPALGRWGVPEACAPTTRELLHAMRDRRPARSEARWAALADWLAALGVSRPRVLWVDDAHHSRDVLDGVAAIAARGAGRAVVVVTVDADAPSLPGAQVLPVGRLEAEAARTLVRQLVGLEDNELARLVERTDGHPAFAIQLVADWVARGKLVPARRGFQLAEGADVTLPDDLYAAWAERLAGLALPPELSEALARLAVWEAGGGLGDARMLAALGGAGEALVARLDQVGMLAARGGVPCIAEPMLREVVNQASEAPAHHAACAALLDDEDPGRRGLHLLAAGAREEAAALLVRGVRRGVERGALSRAADLISAARSVAKPEMVAVLDARMAFLRGDYARCRALALPVGESDAPEAAEAALWVANATLLTGPPAEAARWAERAHALAVSDFDRAATHRLLAEAWVQLGRIPEAESILATLRDHLDPRIRAASWSSSGAAARARRDHVAAEAFYGRAVAEHAGQGDRYRQAIATMAHAGQLRCLERLDEALAAYHEGLRLSEAVGSPDVDLARLNLGWMHVDRGEAAEAEAMLTPALRGLSGIPVLETAVRLGLLTSAGLRQDRGAGQAQLGPLRGLFALPWSDPSTDQALRAAREVWAHDPDVAAAIDALDAAKRAKA